MDNSIARPRELSLKEGKVSLTNFPPEVADKLQEYIAAFDVIPPEVTPTGELTHNALGVSYNKDIKGYEITNILYNPKTKEIKLDTIVFAGDSKRQALDNAKVQFVNSIMKKENL